MFPQTDNSKAALEYNNHNNRSLFQLKYYGLRDTFLCRPEKQIISCSTAPPVCALEVGCLPCWRTIRYKPELSLFLMVSHSCQNLIHQAYRSASDIIACGSYGNIFAVITPAFRHLNAELVSRNFLCRDNTLGVFCHPFSISTCFSCRQNPQRANNNNVQPPCLVVRNQAVPNSPCY